MSIPTLSDLKTYVGSLLTNNDWNFNCQKLVNYLSDGTYDLVFKSFTNSADSSMGGYKITNVATPIAATDASTKGYVDNLSVPMDYIDGCTLVNNATNPNTDIDISAGICQNSTNTQAITLPTTFTKKLNANWVSGSGVGGLDTGSKANSTGYHVIAIVKPDGTPDVLFSTSLTNPTLPTGFTKFRRIGSIRTDSSGNIIQFIQRGDYFYYQNPILDVNSVTTTTAARTLYTLSIPSLSNIMPIISANFNTAGGYLLITSPLTNDTVPSVFTCDISNAGGTANIITGNKLVIASNSQIGVRCTVAATMNINTFGYIDKRGTN